MKNKYQWFYENNGSGYFEVKQFPMYYPAYTYKHLQINTHMYLRLHMHHDESKANLFETKFEIEKTFRKALKYSGEIKI